MKASVLALVAGTALTLTGLASAGVKSIVIVHGAFADGSGWKPVADMLERDGYSVRVVQEPLTSFEEDVAATRRVLETAGPCVLVGHSYGGMVITEAGAHSAVKSLVYVAAFQPDGCVSGGFCAGSSQAIDDLHGDLSSADFWGGIWRQGDCCILEGQAELRGDCEARPYDQSRARAVHEQARPIRNYRTGRQPRDIPLARTRSGGTDRESG